MFTIEAKTVIDAPVHIVWQVLTDFESYSQWSTMLIPEQTEPPRLGDTIKLHLSLPEVDYSFEPIVTQLDENQHFTWRQKTGISGLFDGEHHFELSAINEIQTELHNYEHYSGILSPIFQRLPMMKSAPDGFKSMNQEIKLRAESITQSS